MGGTTLTTPTNDNSWHEWAVTFDAANGQLLIYQDGVPVASTTASPIAITGSTPAFLIGKSGAYYFDGDIAQVRVWTVVRTETDINSDMVSKSPTSTIGLLAAWNFSEGTGTTAADSSGNGHDATINGGAQWITATLPTIPTPPFLGFTITISGGLDRRSPMCPAVSKSLAPRASGSMPQPAASSSMSAAWSTSPPSATPLISKAWCTSTWDPNRTPTPRPNSTASSCSRPASSLTRSPALA